MKRLAIVLLVPSLAQATPLGASAGTDRGPPARSDVSMRAPATGDQSAPAIATGGNAAIAVWQDAAGGASLIRAARMASDGTLIDDPPITLQSSSADTLEQPSVSWDASQSAFWVIWHLRTAGQLQAVQIDPFGMMGMHSFMLAAVDGQAVISGGVGGSLLVFARSGAGLIGRLVSAGAPAAADLPIAPAGAHPSVAYGSSGWLVAYEQPAGAHHDVGATLVAPAGATTALGAINSDATAMNAEHTQPAVAFGGGSFLVAWNDARSGSQIWARALAPSGTPSAADFAVTTSATAKARPQATFAGGHFVVAWDAGASLWGRRVDAPSAPLDAETALASEPAGVAGVPLFADASAPGAIAALGNAAFVAWIYDDAGGRESGADLLSFRADATQPLAAKFSDVLAAGPASERSPRVAWNGQGFLAVWEDARDVAKFSGGLPEGTDLWAQRFDRNGQPNGAPFALVAAPGDQRYPAVGALPGGEFLVAWVDGRKDAGGVWPSQYFTPLDDGADRSRVYATRVSAAGVALDGTGLRIGSSLAQRDRFPSVAADSKNGRFLVSWDAHTDAGNDSVEWVVLDGSAQPLGAAREVPFAVAGTRACGSRAAFTGAGYLMVFESPCAAFSPTVETASVMALRLDATGAPDPSPFTVATGKVEAAPVVASGAGGTLVAWEEHATANLAASDGAIRVAAVDPTSGKVTPQAMPIAALTLESLRWPALAAAGRGFVLTFADETAARVEGVRLAGDGTPAPADAPNGSDPTAMALLSTQPLAPPLSANGQLLPDPSGPALAAGDAGQLLLVYAADGGPSVGRLHARLLQGKLQGDACDPSAMGFGCADGTCTRDPADASAGVCCEGACVGPCELCTRNGCVAAPARDPLCGGAVDCARLSTACRSYAAAQPAACVAFGECAAPDSPAACTQSQNAPDGTACALAGCTQAACAGGECVCSDGPRDYGPTRGAPGCDFGAGGPSGILALLVLALALRRRAWLALLLCGCSGTSGLGVELDLADALFTETARVRVVVKSAGGSFAPHAPSRSGAIVVRNVDLDRDGADEIVIDLEPAYSFHKPTRLSLDAPDATPRAVTVAAEAYNRFGNPIGSADPAAAMLPSGSVTLSLACAAGCAHATEAMLSAALDPANAGGDRRASFHAATGLYASEAIGRVVLALGDLGATEAQAGAAAQPEIGRVALVAPDSAGQMLAPERWFSGRAAGDRLGASVALGDADGDGKLDLVVGAPGSDAGAGRIYLISDVGGLSSTPDLGKVPSLAGATGEQLGAAVAIVGGAIVAGAPGSAAESAGALHRIGGVPLAITASATGTAGAQLGRLVDGIDGVIAAAAPGSGKVYVIDPSELNGAEPPRWFAAPFAVGALALVDVDADGTPELALAPAAAAEEVRVYNLPPGGVPGDGELRCAIHAAAGVGMAAIQRAPGRFGDALSIGAASAGFLLAGAAIDAAGKSLPLGLDGTLATFTAVPPSGAITRLAATRLLPGGARLLAADDQGRLYVGP